MGYYGSSVGSFAEGFLGGLERSKNLQAKNIANRRSALELGEEEARAALREQAQQSRPMSALPDLAPPMERTSPVPNAAVAPALSEEHANFQGPPEPTLEMRARQQDDFFKQNAELYERAMLLNDRGTMDFAARRMQIVLGQRFRHLQSKEDLTAQDVATLLNPLASALGIQFGVDAEGRLVDPLNKDMPPIGPDQLPNYLTYVMESVSDPAGALSNLLTRQRESAQETRAKAADDRAKEENTRRQELHDHFKKYADRMAQSDLDYTQARINHLNAQAEGRSGESSIKPADFLRMTQELSRMIGERKAEHAGFYDDKVLRNTVGKPQAQALGGAQGVKQRVEVFAADLMLAGNGMVMPVQALDIAEGIVSMALGFETNINSLINKEGRLYIRGREITDPRVASFVLDALNRTATSVAEGAEPVTIIQNTSNWMTDWFIGIDQEGNDITGNRTGAPRLNQRLIGGGTNYGGDGSGRVIGSPSWMPTQ